MRRKWRATNGGNQKREEPKGMKRLTESKTRKVKNKSRESNQAVEALSRTPVAACVRDMISCHINSSKLEWKLNRKRLFLKVDVIKVILCVYVHTLAQCDLNNIAAV